MKSMREKPYCGSVSQERLEDVQEEYRNKLCGRIDKLLGAWSQCGENSLLGEKAWADFTFSITTLFDGNDPKAMRLVLEQFIGESVGRFRGDIINRLQSLLGQDAAWVDEDTLDQGSMDEDEYTSDSEEDRGQSPLGKLAPNTLFSGIGIAGHATAQIRDAGGSPCHESGSVGIGSSASSLKRTMVSVTPERGQKEKKTISPEDCGVKKRKIGEWDNSSLMTWDWPTKSSAGIVTPEDKVKQGELQKEIDLSNIPSLVFPN